MCTLTVAVETVVKTAYRSTSYHHDADAFIIKRTARYGESSSSSAAEEDSKSEAEDSAEEDFQAKLYMGRSWASRPT